MDMGTYVYHFRATLVSIVVEAACSIAVYSSNIAIAVWHVLNVAQRNDIIDVFPLDNAIGLIVAERELAKMRYLLFFGYVNEIDAYVGKTMQMLDKGIATGTTRDEVLPTCKEIGFAWAIVEVEHGEGQVASFMAVNWVLAIALDVERAQGKIHLLWERSYLSKNVLRLMSCLVRGMLLDLNERVLPIFLAVIG